uniref:beta-N-acetylhexosaminidase n=1 Tax=Caenorhabditis japonica TaxID=281687 RepID=A0A8R1I3I3_CAEJA
MLRGFFGRRSRSVWIRLTYLCLVTLVFLFVSSQFKSATTHARFVPPEQEPNLEHQSAFLDAPQQQQQQQQEIHKINAPDPPTTQKFKGKPRKTAEDLIINGEKYPKLNSDGKLIPQRRIIHLDLKGAPFRPHFFTELFSFFNRIGATGVLFEWEDMFPYQGRLREAVNKNAYSLEEVEAILQEAKKHHLQIIPLVQTMGHLEWILKLEKFANLREDPRFPQVICFSDDSAWQLIQEMVTEVAEVHVKYGMPYFHIGADEAYQIGICNASVTRLQKEVTRERLMLWHIARTAEFVKTKYADAEILAWHDMMASAMESDIEEYRLTELVTPVLWNYAEDLDMYLPRSTWMLLKSFGKVWGSSAWKGADGPARYSTHSMHYVRNHESWIKQFAMVYRDFEVVEGLIMASWSRYDHLAVLAELLPVALPTLALSIETIQEGRNLNGHYPQTSEILQCTPPLDLGRFASMCRFPGSRIYELVNELYQKRRELRKYRDEDFELNGWLSRVADEYSVSSHWYIDKIEQMIEMHAAPMEQLAVDLRYEMEKIYFADTIDEFLFTYVNEDLEWLRAKKATIKRISEAKHFPKRPFIDGKTDQAFQGAKQC